MKSLTSSQRQLLRASAHHLNVVLQTGARGLTPEFIAEAEVALAHHELVKFKLVAAESEDRKAMAGELCEALDAVLVQHIGHVAVLYRENKERARFRDQLRRA
ncbi:MAG: ribosome assembly RNA-binding protein YhbY [Pseudomonadota bacterium]|nr:ribosome assembly RNA-binding protein YhbY [Pseudomonadota bacterium]